MDQKLSPKMKKHLRELMGSKAFGPAETIGDVLAVAIVQCAGELRQIRGEVHNIDFELERIGADISAAGQDCSSAVRELAEREC
jgi:hypothetical protein